MAQLFSLGCFAHFTMKPCPKCRLTWPESQATCDCGYSFSGTSPAPTSFADRPAPYIQHPTTPPVEQQVRVGAIIRDIVIVWILTAIGGFVVGFATGGREQDPQGYILGILAANFLLGTVAFTIVGCLAPADRWRHLGFVAIGAWLTSIINVLFFGVTVPQWIFGALFMAFIMGFGGAISYVFKKRPAA